MKLATAGLSGCASRAARSASGGGVARREPRVERVHQRLRGVVVHGVGGGDDGARATADDDRGGRDDAGADVAGRGRRLAGRQHDAAGAHPFGRRAWRWTAPRPRARSTTAADRRRGGRRGRRGARRRAGRARSVPAPAWPRRRRRARPAGSGRPRAVASLAPFGISGPTITVTSSGRRRPGGSAAGRHHEAPRPRLQAGQRAPRHERQARRRRDAHRRAVARPTARRRAAAPPARSAAPAGTGPPARAARARSSRANRIRRVTSSKAPACAAARPAVDRRAADDVARRA